MVDVSLAALIDTKKALLLLSGKMSGIASKATSSANGVMYSASSRVRSVKNKVEESRRAIRAFQAEVKDIETIDIPFHEGKLIEAKEKMNRAISREGALRGEIASTQAQIAALSSSDSEESIREVSALQSKLGSLNSELAQVQAEKSAAILGQRDHECQLGNLKARRNQVLGQIEEEQRRLRSLEESLRALESILPRLRHDLGTYVALSKQFEYAADEQVRRKSNAVERCIYSIEKYMNTSL